MQAASDTKVDTTQGVVKGFPKNGVAEFLGIPYAAPPAGSLRWRSCRRTSQICRRTRTRSFRPGTTAPSGTRSRPTEPPKRAPRETAHDRGDGHGHGHGRRGSGSRVGGGAVVGDEPFALKSLGWKMETRRRSFSKRSGRRGRSFRSEDLSPNEVATSSDKEMVAFLLKTEELGPIGVQVTVESCTVLTVNVFTSKERFGRIRTFE